MKSSIVLSALGSASVAFSHGVVSSIKIAGTSHSTYDPYADPYKNPAIKKIGWTVPSNGPVTALNTADIVCNGGSKPGAISAKAAAGSDMTFNWTPWPESHKGPTMTYLASCPGKSCAGVNPSTLNWFKIHHAGLNPDGTWVSDTIIKGGNAVTVKIPSDIKAGPYLVRHELLALHSAGQVGGAQFYPMCANLDITGTGTAVPKDTVKFPGAYKAEDKGIHLNIFFPVPKTYAIPGPAPYVSGGGSGAAAPKAPAAKAPKPVAARGTIEDLPTLLPDSNSTATALPTLSDPSSNTTATAIPSSSSAGRPKKTPKPHKKHRSKKYRSRKYFCSTPAVATPTSAPEGDVTSPAAATPTTAPSSAQTDAPLETEKPESTTQGSPKGKKVTTW